MSGGRLSDIVCDDIIEELEWNLQIGEKGKAKEMSIEVLSKYVLLLAVCHKA